MIRLNRCSRFGGGETKTRRCAPGRTLAVALAVAFAVLAIGGVSSFAPGSAAIAQTAGTAGPVSLGDLFIAPDSTHLMRETSSERRSGE